MRWRPMPAEGHGYVHRRQKIPRETRHGSGVDETSSGQLCAAGARAEGVPRVYLLDGGPDVIITISMFDSAAEALVSNEKAADWVRNHVMEFARGMPEVMVGDVRIAEVK